MKYITAVALVAATLLTACEAQGPTEKDVRVLMDKVLQDPKSLQFQNTKNKTLANEEVFCGMLNFRTTNGGYGQWIPFRYIRTEKGNTMHVGLGNPLIEFHRGGFIQYKEKDDWDALTRGIPIESKKLKSIC